jgi:hypothetical protein
VNQVGDFVLYQPTPGQWPTAYYQHAAIITGWNEQNNVANLIVFPDGANYPVAKNGVREGTEDGTFQQLGVLSQSAETQKQRNQQQAEIFRQISGVK